MKTKIGLLLMMLSLPLFLAASPLLMTISLTGILWFLLYAIIILAVAGLIWWLVKKLPVSPTVLQFIRWVVIVVAIIVLILILISVLGGGGVNFR